MATISGNQNLLVEARESWSSVGVIAVDPGHRKCGLAAVTLEGQLIHKTIVSTGDVAGVVARLVTAAPRAVVVIGAGTASRHVRTAIAAALPNLNLELIPESYSTQLALDLWRNTERPRGWRRLLPRSLRFPSSPIDDYAAWVLALGYLEKAPAKRTALERNAVSGDA